MTRQAFAPARLIAPALWLLLLLAPTVAAAADQLAWFAGLYPDNPAWIQVQVDTRGVSSNTNISNVNFSVGFRDGQGEFLGIQTLPFTVGLAPGAVYQQFFPNPYPSAARADGLSLSSSLDAVGQLFDKKGIVTKNGTVFVPSGIAAAPSRPVGSAVQMVGAAPARAATLLFNIPRDGAPNNNGTIGPFCCTGHTATVTDSAGRPVGYIYSFGFTGGGKAGAKSTTVLVSAAQTPGNGSGAQTTAAARFNAATWTPGATQVVRVGALTYAITLQGVLINEGGSKAFDLNALTASVRVSGVN